MRSDDWFLTADGWEPLSLWDMHAMGDSVVAASSGIEPSSDGRFRVDVWISDEWLPATEAPFGSRNWGTTVLTGTKLLVVGGHQGHRDEPLNLVGDAWVLDLSQD